MAVWPFCLWSPQLYTEEKWPLKEYENAKWRGHLRNFVVVPVVGTLTKLFMSKFTVYVSCSQHS